MSKLKKFKEISEATNKMTNCSTNAIQKPSEMLRTPNFSLNNNTTIIIKDAGNNEVQATLKNCLL